MKFIFIEEGENLFLPNIYSRWIKLCNFNKSKKKDKLPYFYDLFPRFIKIIWKIPLNFKIMLLHFYRNIWQKTMTRRLINLHKFLD